MAAPATERDPRHRTRKMQKRLQEIKDHLRSDIEKVDEPQLKAMFETSAEVLGGLIKAFHDYGDHLTWELAPRINLCPASDFDEAAAGLRDERSRG